MRVFTQPMKKCLPYIGILVNCYQKVKNKSVGATMRSNAQRAVAYLQLQERGPAMWEAYCIKRIFSVRKTFETKQMLICFAVVKKGLFPMIRHFIVMKRDFIALIRNIVALKSDFI